MLEVTDVKKTFHPGTPNEVRALQGVSLSLERGSFVCVIGTNGSGKSTLLNAVAGTFLVDSGRIQLDGTDITRWPEHRRAKLIGRVFQDPFSGTAPSMTIAENLALAARLGTLSGGQRQSLTLLMAGLKKPSLLLLDEHTAALDPKSADQVIRLTQEFISRDQLTTLMVTHSMQQAAFLGDRVIMMDRGRIAFDIAGQAKRRLRPEDLLSRFEELRRANQLDESAAEMLRTQYV
jgi:putative ABC transport system ATP-binding protein